MADSQVQIKDASDVTVDVDAQVTAGGDERQVVVIGDPDTDAAVAEVVNGQPGSSDYGLVVRQPGFGEVQASPTSNTLLARLKDLLTGIVLAAGANLIGDVGLQPRASGGLTIYRLLSAASTNGNNVKASAGQLYGWYVWNNNNSVRYLKLYNKASAPTVGTDTPVMTIPLPSRGGTNVWYGHGIAFGTGIGIGLTTAVADASTAAVAADDIIVNLLYA